MWIGSSGFELRFHFLLGVTFKQSPKFLWVFVSHPLGKQYSPHPTLGTKDICEVFDSRKNFLMSTAAIYCVLTRARPLEHLGRHDLLNSVFRRQVL